MKKVNHSIRPVALFLTLTLLIGSMTVFLPKAKAETGKGMTNEKMRLPNASITASDDPSEMSTSYGKTPLVFEENRGQTDPQVKFVARGGGYAVYLTPSEAVFSLRTSTPDHETAATKEIRALSEDKNQNAKTKDVQSDVLRMQFVGANSNAKLDGVEKQIGTTNVYKGKNTEDRTINIPNFAGVKYSSIYKGVDLVFYGNEHALEYDFVVAPNADTQLIRIAFDGAETVSIDNAGNLNVKTTNAEISQAAPFLYQEVAGQKQKIEGRFVLRGTREVGFEVGEYDRSLPLVIDPAFTYLTYIGGTDFENVDDIKIDTSGNAYVVGATRSLDFPTPGARVASDKLGVFVAKIDPTGSQFLYTSFIDGSEDDQGFCIALDGQNNVYIGGITLSSDFPVTSGAYDTHIGIGNNGDAFVAKLDANGLINYATFYGGAGGESVFDIAVDSGGKAYIVGDTHSTSGGFPLKHEYQNCGRFLPSTNNSTDAFLGVLNAAGSDITYSTCFGGGGYVNRADFATSVALDSANNVYITGNTDEPNFPTKNAIQTSNAGADDAFIVKFNPSLNGNDSLIYSTYLGGSGTDVGNGIAVSADGTAFVAGLTGSLNFPLKNPLRSTNQINEAFVTVLNPFGQLSFSTFIGGSGQEAAGSIALGNGGTIYIVGNTTSTNFPLAAPLQSTLSGPTDGFVTKLRFTGTSPAIASSTYLGGSDADSVFNIAVNGAHIFAVGATFSNNLPTVSPNIAGPIKATSNASSTNQDGFVAKILDTRKDTIGVYDSANTIFRLKNTLADGRANILVDRGAAGDIPVAGDFNGDGIDTVSTFNNGTWRIQNFNEAVPGYPSAAIVSSFGQAGDLPIVGDWNGDGIDSLGVFRPSTKQFFLSNDVVNPAVDFTSSFGLAGDLPVAGDWDGDGIDSVGVFRPSQGTFFLTNQNVASPAVNITVFFGTAEDLPIIGDWDGNGKDTIGVWRPSVTTFFLSNDNVNVLTPIVFGAQADKPVSGDWDGKA